MELWIEGFGGKETNLQGMGVGHVRGGTAGGERILDSDSLVCSQSSVTH